MGVLQREKQLKSAKRLITSQSAGELIHIDCKYAAFTPASNKNLLLTTITDDYSRFILAATLSDTDMLDNENNIQALERVLNTYGLPEKYFVSEGHYNEYFVDCDIKKIKSIFENHTIDRIYRITPYSDFNSDASFTRLQDNLTRECMNKGITDINEAQKILNEVVDRHNYRLINTISQEPPFLRLKSDNRVWRKASVN